jgi:putative ABC transport system permease protein
LIGAGGGTVRPWTIVRGADITGAGQLVINEHAASLLGIQPGAAITVRASCSRGTGVPRAAPPPVTYVVTGIVSFPFDAPDEAGAGTTVPTLALACGEDTSDADFLLVTSGGDPAAAAVAIAARFPQLRTFTNEQLIGRLQAGGFTYFQQISAVLTTVTVSFALLLITVLLTVSVNQRLGEIAALRALGFSASRVAADVFCESALLVGIGGLISLPLGLVMATWLDTILKRMPGIPAELHFFVFDPSALGVHAALLGITALLAALYPMRIVSRLPIAATLRAEVVS